VQDNLSSLSMVIPKLPSSKRIDTLATAPGFRIGLNLSMVIEFLIPTSWQYEYAVSGKKKGLYIQDELTWSSNALDASRGSKVRCGGLLVDVDWVTVSGVVDRE